MKKTKLFSVASLLLFIIIYFSISASAAERPNPSKFYSQDREKLASSVFESPECYNNSSVFKIPEDFDNSTKVIYSTDPAEKGIQKETEVTVGDVDGFTINKIEVTPILDPDVFGYDSEKLSDKSSEDSALDEEALEEKQYKEECEKIAEMVSENLVLRKSDDAQNVSTKTISTVAAALPDLVVEHFYVTDGIDIYDTYPWPSHVDTPFYVSITNEGNARASIVRVDIKIDGRIISSVDKEYLDPGEGYYGEIPINGILIGAGKHTVELEVNANRVIAESNYNNNINGSTEYWQDCLDLQVKAIYTENEELHANQDELLIIKVFNIGKKDIPKSKIILRLCGQIIYTSINEEIRYGLGWTYGLNVRQDFKIDPADFKASIDPYNTSVKDVYTDNNQKSLKTIYNYAIEHGGNKWLNSNNITVGVCPSAIEFFEMFDLSFNVMKTQIEMWNRHSSNVGIIVTRADTEFPDTRMKVIAADFSNDQIEQIARSYAFTKRACIKGTVMNLNYGQSDWGIISSSAVKSILTHEMGHALGLNHSTCADKSIMSTYLSDPEYTTSITAHDIYNLQDLYGK